MGDTGQCLQDQNDALGAVGSKDRAGGKGWALGALQRRLWAWTLSCLRVSFVFDFSAVLELKAISKGLPGLGGTL